MPVTTAPYGTVNAIKSLVSALQNVGFDREVSPSGAFTIDRETTDAAPKAIPLIPGLPGVVLKQKGTPLTPEDKSHEGLHALLGLPGAMVGQASAMALGLDKQAGILAPDEVLARLVQPASESTESDMRTMDQLAESISSDDIGVRSIPRNVYLALVQALARQRYNK